MVFWPTGHLLLDFCVFPCASEANFFFISCHRHTQTYTDGVMISLRLKTNKKIFISVVFWPTGHLLLALVCVFPCASEANFFFISCHRHTQTYTDGVMIRLRLKTNKKIFISVVFWPTGHLLLALVCVFPCASEANFFFISLPPTHTDLHGRGLVSLWLKN